MLSPLPFVRRGFHRKQLLSFLCAANPVGPCKGDTGSSTLCNQPACRYNPEFIAYIRRRIKNLRRKRKEENNTKNVELELSTYHPPKSFGSLLDFMKFFNSSDVKACGWVCECLINISSNFVATNLNEWNQYEKPIRRVLCNSTKFICLEHLLHK